MKVREAVSEDRPEWARMRKALWPGSDDDHEHETSDHFAGRGVKMTVLVAEADDGALVGFLELGERSHAPGCESSPVPFIEGWYLDPAARGKGIGKALVRAAEEHARAAGFTEIASDVEIGNEDSIAAHVALGYEETDRVVSFRRSLGQP